MNPRKLKPGDRLLWSDDMLLLSNCKEEVVVSVNKEKFRTVDKDCTIHEYSTEGKILNCHKITKYDSTIHVDDLIGEMEIHLVKKCREITEVIALLEKLV